MSQISSPWPIVALHEICRPTQWPTIPQTAFVDKGYPVYGANGKIGCYTEFNHEKPTVLITCRGATCGTINVSEPKSYVTGNAMALDDLQESIVSREYLVYALRRVGLSRAISGTAQPQITRQSLTAISIRVPPLTEQRRIAAILDQAEQLQAKRRAALAQIDTLTQAIFIELFGDPTINPRGWPTLNFADVCHTRLGKMLDQKQQTGKHQRPYLRNANVQWFRFDLSDIFEMDFDDNARQLFRLRNGDLLICEGGEPGRAAIWNGEIAECYYQKALHCARPRSELAKPEYLNWLLWFFAQRGRLSDHVTSATIAHLTGEKLAAMSIPVPPLALQVEFVHRLVIVEKIKTAHLSSLAEINELFASLQHRAFRGEL
ncbi:MAG TPA: restriction endonuclease subunit S [Candidatus Angelobacter sp.]|nr:restriction endonuclease subunit S [Candidatus Angelobacter sp.]